MSNENTKKQKHNRRDPAEAADGTGRSLVPQDSGEFDPRFDGESVMRQDVSERDALSRAFGRFLPSNNEISAAARKFFGADLPENLVFTLIQESEEVAHSTRKIISEHMRMGGNFLHIRTSVTNYMVGQHGDSKRITDRAATLVYAYLRAVFGYSQSRIKVYMDCYEKFMDNSAAVEALKVSDMQLLLRDDTPDELVDLVIQARNEDPSLTKKQVKEIINGYRAQRNQLTAATEQLTSATEKIDQLQLENSHLLQERDTLKDQLAEDRKSADKTQVALKNSGNTLNVLNKEVADRDRDIERLTRELAEAVAKPVIQKEEVPTVPLPFKTLEDAIEAQLTRKREIEQELEQQIALKRQAADDVAQKQREIQQLQQQLEQQRLAIDASQKAENRVNRLLELFGAFAQEYHTTQLLVTADGKPARYAPMFTALADLIGKFHSELVAAVNIKFA